MDTMMNLSVNMTMLLLNSDDSIEQKNSLKDLGVIMNDQADFTDHIAEVCKNVRKIMSWICRAFLTRSLPFMKFMWRSYC